MAERDAFDALYGAFLSNGGLAPYSVPGSTGGGVAMIGVTPIDKFRAFNPEAAHALDEAFDGAWKALKASRSLFTTSFRADKAREILALRIIELAQRGERDPIRLRDEVLDNLK